MRVLKIKEGNRRRTWRDPRLRYWCALQSSSHRRCQWRMLVTRSRASSDAWQSPWGVVHCPLTESSSKRAHKDRERKEREKKHDDVYLDVAFRMLRGARWSEKSKIAPLGGSRRRRTDTVVEWWPTFERPSCLVTSSPWAFLFLLIASHHRHRVEMKMIPAPSNHTVAHDDANYAIILNVLQSIVRR